MLKDFLGAWFIYWAVVALLPVSSLYPATGQAFLLQASFVLLVVLGYGVAATAFGASKMPFAGQCDILSTRRLIRLALVVSLLGLAALAYDKVVVQGIDYSENIAAAREEWRRLGVDREGQASSLFSMIGYLLGSAYYVVVVLAITQVRALSARERVWALLASFALLMANSAITGGRSGILLMIAVVMGALTSRRGLSSGRLFARPAHRRLVQVLAIAAAVYLVFVFFERAEAGEVEALEYVLEFLPFLGVEILPWYRDFLDGSALSSLSAMLVLTASYVSHSFATVAAIIDGPVEDKTLMFLHASTILHKLGLAAAPDGDWFLVGRFASIPGALWHQFGGIGFVVGSALIGVASACTSVWTQRWPRRLLPLGAFVMAYAVLLLSPAVFAADFLNYPFVVGAFVMLTIASRSRGSPRRRRSKPVAALSRAV